MIMSLNPYCTGTDSLSITLNITWVVLTCGLNPYCTGTDSLSARYGSRPI